ncbi:MAG: hypothetical protein LBK25_05085 [Treponema sp.]|jgi:hypothetical protein|nr:hypothetical protein [Treponema sp.]
MYPKIFLLLLITIGIMLIWFGLSFLFKRRNLVEKTIEAVPARKSACPLCSALLEKGERIRSIAFPQSTRLINERIMDIRGCPHCLHGGRQRICPVCSALLSVDDTLIARMIENNGKTQVKICGCSKCCEVPQ